MKKFLMFGAVIVILAFLAGAAGLAYAQNQTPPQGGGFGRGMMGGWRSNDGSTQNGYGPGRMGGERMGGRGMMGGQYGSGAYGPMHDYMIPALEAELGLEAGELQARIDQGQTPYDVAVELGFTAEEIQQKFSDAHTAALEAAVEAGVLTQEQADWMQSHMQQRWEGGFGPGQGPCHQGFQPNS